MHFKYVDWKTTHIRPTVKEVLERISHKQHNPKIRYIVLFGSEARGESRLASDVDIALVSDKPLTRSEKLEFKEIFEDNSFPDFQVINTLTESLDTDNFADVNYHIKRDGLVIYER